MLQDYVYLLLEILYLFLLERAFSIREVLGIGVGGAKRGEGLLVLEVQGFIILFAGVLVHISLVRAH